MYIKTNSIAIMIIAPTTKGQNNWYKAEMLILGIAFPKGSASLIFEFIEADNCPLMMLAV